MFGTLGLRLPGTLVLPEVWRGATSISGRIPLGNSTLGESARKDLLGGNGRHALRPVKKICR